MNFRDLPEDLQERMYQILNDHLSYSTKILAKDKYVMPMLMTQGDDPAANQLIGLQARDGQTDFDKAFSMAIEMLKRIDFKTALYAYSTEVTFGDGRKSAALKTYVFEKTAPTVVFLTPYSRSGFIKKKVNYDKSYVSEIIENIYEQVTTLI